MPIVLSGVLLIVCVEVVSGLRSLDAGVVSWVVVVMAFSSLLSMVFLLQLDRVVEGGLVGAGLGSGWYVSYSGLVQGVFALCWFNIVAAVGVHLYQVTFRRKEVEQLVREAEIEMRRQQVEALRRSVDPPPILPGLPEHEALAKSEAKLVQEKEILTAEA